MRGIIDTVLRLAKERGIPETEVHVEEVIDALTRFANNAIHQHVAEHGVVVSVRTVVDGRRPPALPPTVSTKTRFVPHWMIACRSPPVSRKIPICCPCLGNKNIVP